MSSIRELCVRRVELVAVAADKFAAMLDIVLFRTDQGGDPDRIRKSQKDRYADVGLVDKVIEFEPGKRCVGIKKVTTNEEFFNGHFPERPIMPGVLQVEAMAQVGGMIALQQPITDGKGDFFFTSVNKIK